MFASYVICSIKQTTAATYAGLLLFASYVICSIKQTTLNALYNTQCLLVMLFVVLSKLLYLEQLPELGLLVMLFVVLSKLLYLE